MDSRVVVTILLAEILVSCLAEPPSRLNLFRFFMGFGPEKQHMQKISFNPDAGLRYREQYEKKYGPRGQLLIERFGKGLGPEGSSVVDEGPLEYSKNKTKLYSTYDFNPPKNKGKSVTNKTKAEAITTTNSPEPTEVF